MKIWVPVAIFIDECDASSRVRSGSAKGKTVFFEFDHEDEDVPTRYTTGDPMNLNKPTKWHEGGQWIFEIISSDEWDRLIKRVKKHPDDYKADED